MASAIANRGFSGEHVPYAMKKLKATLKKHRSFRDASVARYKTIAGGGAARIKELRAAAKRAKANI